VGVVDGRSSPRETATRAYLHRWAEAAGAQVLVVDPEEDRRLVDAMACRGVHVTWRSSAVDGLIEFGRLDPHMVVLAPHSPGMGAQEFVTALTSSGAAHLVLAEPGALGAESAELLVAGAHGVVRRPYHPDELWRALLQAPRALDDHARVRFGPGELDAGAYRVTIDGVRIADLPLKEFELLRTLMLAAPEVVTDDALRAALWGAGGRRASGNTIAMHVTRLRRRLGDAIRIRRIRGRGYALTQEGVSTGSTGAADLTPAAGRSDGPGVLR
jgi:DNA-binding response OmpR family regulator